MAESLDYRRHARTTRRLDDGIALGASGDTKLDNWWEADYAQGGFAGLTAHWRLNTPVIAALTRRSRARASSS